MWERKISIIATGLGMFIFALMFAALHESVAEEIGSFADAFPPELGAVIGDLSAASTPAGFLNIELYSLFLPFALAITGITFAAKAIGKEEESGTLELLLASPISRNKIILQKMFAITITLAIIAFSSWLGVLVGQALFVFDVNLGDVAIASASVFLLGMVYAMASLAGQAVTGKSKVGLGVGAGLLVLTYFADLISSLVENLEWIKYASPFHYMDMSAVLNGNGELINFAILLAVAVVFYVIAHAGFLKRDTGV